MYIVFLGVVFLSGTSSITVAPVSSNGDPTPCAATQTLFLLKDSFTLDVIDTCMDIDRILPVFLSVAWKLADTYQMLQYPRYCGCRVRHLKPSPKKHSVQMPMPDKGSHPAKQVVKSADRHLEVPELAFVINFSRWLCQMRRILHPRVVKYLTSSQTSGSRNATSDFASFLTYISLLS